MGKNGQYRREKGDWQEGMRARVQVEGLISDRVIDSSLLMGPVAKEESRL
jgi:hypothetical protein